MRTIAISPKYRGGSNNPGSSGGAGSAGGDRAYNVRGPQCMLSEEEMEKVSSKDVRHSI